MNKIISVYWFVILVIVAGGIFAMVSIFYSSPYDAREIEADILSQKIADCLSFEGELNSNLFDAGNFNESFKDTFLKECHFNLNSEGYENIQYYLSVNFFSVGNIRNSMFEIVEGNKNFLAQCSIQEEKEYGNLVRCKERRFYSLSPDGDQYLIQINSVVGKIDKNAR